MRYEVLLLYIGYVYLFGILFAPIYNHTVSTGSAADGKIFIKDISEAYDIGSKQTGDPAL